MKVEFYIKLLCAKCREEVTGKFYGDHYEHDFINVTPCKKCLEAARTEGRIERDKERDEGQS